MKNYKISFIFNWSFIIKIVIWLNKENQNPWEFFNLIEVTDEKWSLSTATLDIFWLFLLFVNLYDCTVVCPV